MEDFKTWYEARLIAGRKIRTREDDISWKELRVEIDKLLDIIMSPHTDEAERVKAKALAGELGRAIERSGYHQIGKPAPVTPEPVTL